MSPAVRCPRPFVVTVVVLYSLTGFRRLHRPSFLDYWAHYTLVGRGCTPTILSHMPPAELDVKPEVGDL